MIRQSYDLDADALYIELADGQAARTVQIDEGTLVDLDQADNVLGIEVIQPGRTWPLDEIVTRFDMRSDVAQELRAYFERPAQLVPPVHPEPRVPVTVG